MSSRGRRFRWTTGWHDRRKLWANSPCRQSAAASPGCSARLTDGPIHPPQLIRDGGWGEVARWERLPAQGPP